MKRFRSAVLRHQHTYAFALLAVWLIPLYGMEQGLQEVVDREHDKRAQLAREERIAWNELLQEVSCPLCCALYKADNPPFCAACRRRPTGKRQNCGDLEPETPPTPCTYRTCGQCAGRIFAVEEEPCPQCRQHPERSQLISQLRAVIVLMGRGHDLPPAGHKDEWAAIKKFFTGNLPADRPIAPEELDDILMMVAGEGATSLRRTPPALSGPRMGCEPPNHATLDARPRRKQRDLRGTGNPFKSGSPAQPSDWDEWSPHSDAS